MSSFIELPWVASSHQDTGTSNTPFSSALLQKSLAFLMTGSSPDVCSGDPCLLTDQCSLSRLTVGQELWFLVKWYADQLSHLSKLVLWGCIPPAFPWPGCLQCLLMCGFRLSGSSSVCMAWWQVKRRGGTLEVSQGDRCRGESYTFQKEGYSCAWVQILEIPMYKSRLYISPYLWIMHGTEHLEKSERCFGVPSFIVFFHEFQGLNPANRTCMAITLLPEPFVHPWLSRMENIFKWCPL